MVYLQLKDKSNSNGILAAGVLYNNATVSAYEDNKVPLKAKQLLKAGVLTKATKKEFDARQKDVAQAKELAKHVQEQRNERRKKELAIKGLKMKAGKELTKAQLEAKKKADEKKDAAAKKDLEAKKDDK